MPSALISITPLTVVQAFQTDVITVNVPGVVYAQNVTVGYASPNGAFQVVAYDHFQPPVGKVAVGQPSYSVAAVGQQFIVTETFAVADPPPPTPIVSAATFRGLFTDSEQLALATAAQTNPALRLLIDDSLIEQVVDLTSAKVAGGFSLLVTAGVLTQTRADQILAFRQPVV